MHASAYQSVRIEEKRERESGERGIMRVCDCKCVFVCMGVCRCVSTCSLKREGEESKNVPSKVAENITSYFP